jgi:hypothetical protein
MKVSAVILSALLVGISTPARADNLQNAAYSALAAANALDLHSTFRAIHSGGGTEGNPLLTTNHPAAAIAEKAAMLGAVVWMGERIRTHGHPKAARIVVWVLAGTTAGIAAHNYALAR